MTSLFKKSLFISSLLLLALVPGIIVAQICKDYIPDNHPNTRYTVNDDGTVTDTYTKLMWKQCFEGLSGAQCDSGDRTQVTWAEALNLADSSDFAGKTDWRVPNASEVDTLIRNSCDIPINLDIFPSIINTTRLWTSTPYPRKVDKAYYFYFNYGGKQGYMERSSNNYDVQLVRNVD
jgi:hypothetical protein